jgi:hypothetical protein
MENAVESSGIQNKRNQSWYPFSKGRTVAMVSIIVLAWPALRTWNAFSVEKEKMNSGSLYQITMADTPAERCPWPYDCGPSYKFYAHNLKEAMDIKRFMEHEESQINAIYEGHGESVLAPAMPPAAPSGFGQLLTGQFKAAQQNPESTPFTALLGGFMNYFYP